MTTISTSSFYDRANAQLGSLRGRAETLQVQVSTGERLARSSDDPVAAARLRDLSRRSTLSEVDRANSDRAEVDLKLADGALYSIADVIIRTRELTVQAANGSLAENQRAMIGKEIEELGSSLMALANARDSSNLPLFGGETTGAAYAAVPGGAAYLGSAAAPQVELSEGQRLPRSLTGPDVFNFTHNGTPTDLFQTLAALSTALTTGGGGAADAANAALSQLDAGLEKVTTSQSIIGARLGWIETLSDRRVATDELRTEEQNRVGGADLATTISRLQETLTVLEASQASFVRLSGLSLFSLLR